MSRAPGSRPTPRLPDIPLFHRIVVPVDGSPASGNAIEVALSIARALASKVWFLFILDRDKLLIDYRLRTGDAVAATIIDGVSSSGKRLLAELGARCDAQGVEHAEWMRVGDVVEEILIGAAEVRADAIVVATHGRGRVATPALGSRTQELLRKSTLPVLVVRLCETRAAGQTPSV